MQVCELLVCVNHEVWAEGMGQSMNCVRDVCDEAQKHIHADSHPGKSGVPPGTGVACIQQGGLWGQLIP